jgi:catechol 2,3-dioxygenase-like lactoylglutathione lyase family enzyme
MIDHISIAVSNLTRAVLFYEAIFAPLGITRVVTRPAMVGFGKTYPEVWINLRADMAPLSPNSGVHLCLRAKTTAEVDAFHAAAMAAGGTSESAPSLRPHDRVKYYATFIADADGNRIEAVTFLKDE